MFAKAYAGGRMAAMLAKCVECRGTGRGVCELGNCPLHPPTRFKKAAVKKYCLWCMHSETRPREGANLIRECSDRDCPLWAVKPYRGGKEQEAPAEVVPVRPWTPMLPVFARLEPKIHSVQAGSLMGVPDEVPTKKTSSITPRILALLENKPFGVCDTTWERLVRRDAAECVMCQEPLSPETGFSYHHRLPRSEGGKAELDNLVLCCPSCHDKIETAGEAMLLVLNRPPSRLQLMGIFAGKGVRLPCQAERIVSPAIRAEHAKRIIEDYPPERMQALLTGASAYGCWDHVDWNMVAGHLGRRAHA